MTKVTFNIPGYPYPIKVNTTASADKIMKASTRGKEALDPVRNRDNLKDAAYFERYLKHQDERISKFVSLAGKAENAKGLSSSETQRAYGFVVKLMIEKLYASYSCGKTAEKIRQIYGTLVDVSKKINSLSYSQLIDIASLAVLLRSERDIKTKVISMMDKDRRTDILLDGFSNFLAGKGFIYNAKDFKFREVYKELSAVITQSDKNKQIELLAEYIKNTWYASNKDSAWYDSHKSREDIYVGYWCFEGLALAVALGLETRKLSGIEYIPDDLIDT
jgi:hypothetical protein